MKLRLLLAAGLVCGAAARGADLRIGIIGCDTSHVLAFTETLNNPEAKGHVPGGKVVAAYKGGSADIPSSISHVEGYSKTLREKYGVKILRQHRGDVQERGCGAAGERGWPPASRTGEAGVAGAQAGVH